MSSIIQLASVRCFRRLPLRRVGSYAGLNPALHLPVGSRFYCFMPRSADVVEKTKRTEWPYDLKVPDDFKLIYKFTAPYFLPITSMFAALLTAGLGMVVYQYMTEISSIKSEEKPPPPNPKVESESQLKKEKKFSWENLTEFYSDLEKITQLNDKVLVILLLPIFILTLLNTRSGIVLCAYRRGNDYLTFHTGRFGFGFRLVEHGCQDVKYFPKRNFQRFQIKGDRVLLFPENFVSENEYLMFRSGGNLKPSNATQ